MTRSQDIQTKRLLITPFREKHLTPCYVGWLNDPDLMRFSENRNNAHTLDSCRAYWQSFNGTPNFFWAIEKVVGDNSHIGNINAYIDKNNLIANVGILIGLKEVQNKGYGIESWLGVCDFLFENAGMRKISAGTLSVNVPMLKLMRRTGMVDDGIRERHYLVEGKEVDIIYMAFFKEQWDKKRLSLKDKGFF